MKYSILFVLDELPFPIRNGVTAASGGLINALINISFLYVYDFRNNRLYSVEMENRLNVIDQKIEEFLLNHSIDVLIPSPIWSIEKAVAIQNIIRKKIHKKPLLIGLISDCYTYVLWRSIVVSWIINRLSLRDLKNSLKIPLVYIREFLAIKKADLVILQTQKDTQVVKKLFKTNTDVLALPNGLNQYVEFTQIMQAKERNGIGFVATFEGPYLDVGKWFIDNVWSKVAIHSNIKLHILGKGSENLGEYITTQYPNLLHSVVIEDFYDNLSDFYLQRKIIVAPIFKNYGLINKTIEAMLHGCITIGDISAFNGLNDFVDKKHGVVAYFPKEFINAILYYSKDENGVKIGAEAHHHVVETFSWQQNAQQILNFIEVRSGVSENFN